MPLLTGLARRALQGHATRHLARVIPNPLVRLAVVMVASALLPVIVAEVSKRRAAHRRPPAEAAETAPATPTTGSATVRASRGRRASRSGGRARPQAG